MCVSWNWILTKQQTDFQGLMELCLTKNTFIKENILMLCNQNEFTNVCALNSIVLKNYPAQTLFHSSVDYQLKR